jgi:hypothetical protein
MELKIYKKRRSPIRIFDSAWAQRADGRVTKLYYLYFFGIVVKVREFVLPKYMVTPTKDGHIIEKML